MSMPMQMKKQEVNKKSGINGAILKWLAIITMAIDHIGGGFLGFYNQSATVPLEKLYTASRMIGRLSFPIFAFLIIQGYQHTSNRRKYAGKLLLFALLSEIPFDLAFYDQVFYLGSQNIFFTLAIGVIGFSFYEKFELENKVVHQIVAVVVSSLLAEVMMTDYGLYGILFIFGLGILRNNKLNQTLFGVAMGAVQMFAASLAFIPIWFYNGERGKQNKWFFYIFYPAHLLLIYFIRLFLQI